MIGDDSLQNKNLLLTIAMGELYKILAELTHPTFINYAKKINADFLSINEKNISQTTPHWEKFQIYDLLKKYDRILYVDTDIIIRADAPNLFDEVPYFELGLFDEAPYTENRHIAFQQACHAYGILPQNWNGKYYNTGVMVISRPHKDLFKKPEREIHNFFEQTYLNVQIATKNIPVHNLKYWFNRMSCMDSLIGEDRHASYFIHYAGFPNPQMLPNVIYNDLKKWEKNHPNYNFKRHILINVQGGLGDQISAEPAIRYLLNHIYVNEDVRIVTHFPRLFTHFNIPVSKHGEMNYSIDTKPWQVITLPGPETVQWSIVSNLLTYTTDFCSMALLKRTLPDKDKQFHLEILPEDKQEVEEIIDCDLENLVLIHAGRHWESKTFPKEWWQKIIDDLYNKGYRICLIGKDSPGDNGEFEGNGARGTVNVYAYDNIIDTRNLLSLGGLIYLISKAKVVISNDSAPIHIAGAFDNYIILIPTCKHPDHILPYRKNGDKHYKSFAFYKKLTLDDFPSEPTTLYTVTADKVLGDFYDYLPETDEIVNCVDKIFGEENV